MIATMVADISDVKSEGKNKHKKIQMGERDKKAIAQEIVPDGVIGKNIGIGYIYSSFSTKNIVVDHVPCAEVYFFLFVGVIR